MVLTVGINGAVKYICKAVYDPPPTFLFKGYAFHCII